MVTTLYIGFARTASVQAVSKSFVMTSQGWGTGFVFLDCCLPPSILKLTLPLAIPWLPEEVDFIVAPGFVWHCCFFTLTLQV